MVLGVIRVHQGTEPPVPPPPEHRHQREPSPWAQSSPWALPSFLCRSASACHADGRPPFSFIFPLKAARPHTPSFLPGDEAGGNWRHRGCTLQSCLLPGTGNGSQGSAPALSWASHPHRFLAHGCCWAARCHVPQRDISVPCPPCAAHP